MHASSPGGVRRLGEALLRSDSSAALASGPFGPAPPCERLPSHVVHDDAKRADLEAIIEAHYPCSLVRRGAATSGNAAARPAPRRTRRSCPNCNARTSRPPRAPPLLRRPPLTHGTHARRRCATRWRRMILLYTVRRLGWRGDDRLLEPAFEWHLSRRRTPRAARHVSVASARRSRPAWRPRRHFARLRRAGSRIRGAAAPHLLLFAPVVGASR